MDLLLVIYAHNGLVIFPSLQCEQLTVEVVPMTKGLIPQAIRIKLAELG
jgi:hypothetical protein